MPLDAVAKTVAAGSTGYSLDLVMTDAQTVMVSPLTTTMKAGL